MATELERIAALETHYEHVDRTLTAMGRTLEAIRAEIAELVRSFARKWKAFARWFTAKFERVRAELGGKLDDIRAAYGRRQGRTTASRSSRWRSRSSAGWWAW